MYSFSPQPAFFLYRCIITVLAFHLVRNHPNFLGSMVRIFEINETIVACYDPQQTKHALKLQSSAAQKVRMIGTCHE